jgi:type VI secretion system secreted protein Hcp
MAIEYHLDVKGIKGESAADKHMEQIELLSFSWGASNPTTIVGQGMSAGKVSVSDLSISKRVDKSSPALLELCITGKHVDDATLYCSKQTGGKTPDDFLIITLHEVYVSSHQSAGSFGEDVGTESVSFTYGKIHYDYKVQDKSGTLSSVKAVEYDVRARKQTA